MAATIKIVVESSGGIGPIRKDIEGLGTSAQGAGGGFSVMKGLAVNALTAVAGAAVEAAGATVGFVTDSVSAAGNFEASVLGMQAVAGDSLAQAGFSFDDVRDKALQLGMDTQYSAQQSIEAMTELVKGGIPVVDVMGEATDATLALASAAGLELAPAAEIMAKQLGVWAETGVTAQEAADLLTSAANASTVGVEDLALGLANAGGTAKTAGVEFEDLVQTMALIAPNFSSASDAGTSLKTFLSRLIPTTQNAKDAMSELGLMTFDTKRAMETLRSEGIEPAGQDVNTLATQLAQLAASQGATSAEMMKFVSSFDKSVFFDMEGNFIGMAEASRLLQEATAGLSEEEKLLAFNTIFGSDAIRAASAIANAGAPGFLAMGDAMNAAGGAAAAAAVKNQGFNFALEQMKGSMETLQIVIGTALLPILTSLLNDHITPLVNGLMGAFQAFQDAGLMSSEFAESMDLVGQALGLPQNMLQNLIFAIQSFASSVLAAIPQIGMGGEAVNQFSGILNLLLTVATNVFNGYMAIINAVLPIVAGFIASHGTEISGFFTQTWNSMVTIATLALQTYNSIVPPVLQAIAGFISAHGAEIQAILSGAWQIITSLITGTLGTITGIFQAALALLKGDWQGAWEAIKGIGEAQFNAIVGVITGAWGIITGIFSTSISNLISVWSGALSQLVDIVSSINWSSVGSSIIDGMVSGVTSAASKLASAAADAAKAAFDAAKSALGISSPSKLFAEGIGEPMAEGMALGLAGGAPMVAAAGAATAGAAYRGATTNTRSFTYSPTINNYGASSGALDYATANALAGMG